MREIPLNYATRELRRAVAVAIEAAVAELESVSLRL